MSNIQCFRNTHHTQLRAMFVNNPNLFRLDRLVYALSSIANLPTPLFGYDNKHARRTSRREVTAIDNPPLIRHLTRSLFA